MKIMALITVISMLLMGIVEKDATAALVMFILFAPMVFERKRVRKCTTQNARNAVQR